MLQTRSSNRRIYQQWELMRPAIGIPAGWVKIQNVLTGHVLHHDYIALPPIAVPPLDTAAAQYRESWGAQWSFLSVIGGGGREGVSWMIKNRLTEGILSHGKNRSALNDRSLSASDKESRDIPLFSLWELEFDRTGDVIIRNGMGSVLEDTGRDRKNGHELDCCKRTFPVTARQLWILVYVPARSRSLRPLTEGFKRPTHRPAKSVSTSDQS